MYLFNDNVFLKIDRYVLKLWFTGKKVW